MNEPRLFPEEIEFIRQKVPLIGIGKTAELLDRAPITVSTHSKRIGVFSPWAPRTRRLTAEDLERIKQLVPLIGCPATARIVKCRDKTVRDYALKFGLQRPVKEPSWSEADNAELARRWPVETSYVIGAAMGRSRSSVCAQARRLGLPGKKSGARPKAVCS